MGTLMVEHINLPGVSRVVVTRAFAYQWMKEIGYDPSDKGFGSMDYAVFGQKAREDKLTDLGPLDGFLVSLALAVRRDCLGVESTRESDRPMNPKRGVASAFADQ